MPPRMVLLLPWTRGDGLAENLSPEPGTGTGAPASPALPVRGFRALLSPVSDDREYVTEQEARRLWQRAAQLQAEAAARAEALASGSDEHEGSPGATRAADPASDGYALTHVRNAALEAGIGPEFVDAAIADLRSERLVPAAGAEEHPLAWRILGKPDPTITIRRRVHAAPRGLLDAMEAILPHDPFNLTLLDRRGDPLKGGVLTFEIQSQGIAAIGRGGFAADLQMASDLTRIHIALVPAPDGASAELVVRGPVSAGWRVGAGLAAVLVAVGGGLCGSAAVGLSTLLGPVAILAVVASVLACVAGGSAGLALSRAVYRYGQRKDEHALDTLASAVAAQAEGGWFRAAAEEVGNGG